MHSTALAARACSDIPAKDLDLNTAIITNAIRILGRMTQSSGHNDRMASSIARHYITQTRPPGANGPIAIIFNYVHEWRAEVDEHFWFQDAGETRVNIRHGPIQTVEQASTRASSKHAIKKAEAKRKRIDGAAQTDWTLTLADINNTTRTTRPHSEPSCQLVCGTSTSSTKRRDDTYHRFWECTALKSTYDEDASLFQDFRHNWRPRASPPAALPWGDVTGACWTGGAGRDQDQLQRKRK